MKNKKLVASIDFDGVIIQKVFGIEWTNQAKTGSLKKGWWSNIYRFFDFNWARINHIWRKPMAGSKQGLMKLKRHGYRLVLVTSRKSYLREITLNWMKKWGYYELFDDFYFNDKFIKSAQSKVENIKKVKASIHVDDNKETVEKLAATYPEMKLVWLNKTNNEIANKSNIKWFSNWNKLWIIKKVRR